MPVKLKFQILNAIARRYGYTSYLEICTHYTGGKYARMDAKQLTHRMRLMYGCPADFDDGAPIDLRTGDTSGEALFLELIRSGRRFDLIFVDPDHTYEPSARDLAFALQLLAPGGTIMVHDCNPTNPTMAEPDFHAGVWCGTTYVAYLDVVLASNDLSHVTVDTDWGCALVSRGDRWKRFSRTRIDPAVVAGWFSTPLREKYAYLDRHREDLLRLITPARFERRLARPESRYWARLQQRFFPRPLPAS